MGGCSGSDKVEEGLPGATFRVFICPGGLEQTSEVKTGFWGSPKESDHYPDRQVFRTRFSRDARRCV